MDKSTIKILVVAIIAIIVVAMVISNKHGEVPVNIPEDVELDANRVSNVRAIISSEVGAGAAGKIDDQLLDEIGKQFGEDLASRHGIDQTITVIIETGNKGEIENPGYVSKYIDAVVKEVSITEIKQLAADSDVKKLWYNAPAELYLYNSVPQINGLTYKSENGGNGVKVCLIDSELKQDHPYLNVYYRDNQPPWTQLHGTHCAGIIQSSHPDYSGVAPKSQLVFLTWHDSIANIEECVDRGAEIISMSWGAGQREKTFCDTNPIAQLINKLVEEKDIIAVAAAGNSADSGGNAPGCASGTIAVAAVDSNNKLASFSSRGEFVDIAAPGVKITSTWNSENGFNTISGTSMACPHVAGSFALLKSISSKPNREIVQAVFDTANLNKCIGISGATCTATEAGHGIIDVYAACVKLEGETKCDKYFSLIPTPRPVVPAPTMSCTKTCESANYECGTLCTSTNCGKCTVGVCANGQCRVVVNTAVRQFTSNKLRPGEIEPIVYNKRIGSSAQFIIENIPAGWTLQNPSDTQKIVNGKLRMFVIGTGEIYLVAPNTPGNYTFTGMYSLDGGQWVNSEPVTIEVR